METTKVAVIGVGDISGIYLENLTKLFKQVEVVGVCDLIRSGRRGLRRSTTSLRFTTPCMMPLPTMKWKSS